MTPTQRSLKFLRDNGYLAAVVEKWVRLTPKRDATGPDPRGHGVRQDLFGFIDVVAIREDKAGVLGVQATSDSNVSKRVQKILGLAEAKRWLAAGNRIEVFGWRKKGSRWVCRRRSVSMGDFQ